MFVRSLTAAAIATALSAAALTAAPAAAGTLENLERERAMLITTLLDADLGPAERQEKVAVAKHRLVDLERMVLRDDSLRGKTTPQVRRAFADYDLTFLVHASVESGTTVSDHWLSRLGLTTSAVMNAQPGRR